MGPTGTNSGPPYQVVVNAAGQYSIWRADRDPPPGWTAVGFSGTREECLAHVDKVWTEMKPRGRDASNE